CASASWASSPFARTCPLRARSTPGKVRPATAVADLATEEEHKEVDTLEGVVPGPADIEEEQERLSGRSWEVSSILRPPLASAADLESVESQLQEALTFLTETLPALAAEIGEQVSGLVFQALLARSSRPLPGHSG
ncbi:ANKRD17, partial [Symbiodinium microadriaticum]